MRRILPGIALLVLPGHAVAGDFDPVASALAVVTAPAFGCQWTFVAGPPLDELQIDFALVEVGTGLPLPGCPVTATFGPLAATVAACPVEAVQTVISDAAGMGSFTYDRPCGWGPFDVTVDVAGVFFGLLGPFLMTSPDLSASCGAGAVVQVDIVDLGMWAVGLGGYVLQSDYSCDGLVGVVDLGIWAGGLGTPACP
jgi:hypothetical protein